NVASAEPAVEQLEFFEKRIRPVLADQCYRCHSADAEKLKGSLQVDHREHLLKGGDIGPAIDPAKPEESLLLESIRYGDPDLQMPPKKKLDDAVIADFAKWLGMGAPWPDEAVPKREAKGQAVAGQKGLVVEEFDLEKRRAEHWCWQPVAAPPPPDVSDPAWPEQTLDRFILARLDAAKLKPAADAAPETWLRRVTFDLTGLPPAPEKAEAFLESWTADPAAAREGAVDELLASKHFGERWARHWMDLARFGETCGHEFDYPIPNAWRYRDYLIDAFNDDLPYDAFLTEHLAGDLLPHPRRDPETGIDASILATGFWFLHEAVHAPTDILADESDRVDNQIDVFGKTFLGVTLGCARCHDHKFDAIGMADYYALYGYLQSSRRQEAFLDPNGAGAEAAARAREIRDRIAPRLASAFGSEAENADAAERFARHLLAAQQVIDECSARSSAEIVFADFEGGNYDGWEISGEAFGARPATGTFPRQQTVSGYRGGGLVNTWNGADRHTGRARSPEFTIGQPYLHFLVGGGGHTGETCVNLLVDGKPVRTATGKNNEKLEPRTWDISEFRGKKARLEIVDEATGGWGHINLDHFVFSPDEAFSAGDPAVRPLDPDVAKRVATQQGWVNDSTLLSWAEELRSEAAGKPGHPFHAWVAGAHEARVRDALKRKLDDAASAHAAARKEAAVLADFADGDAAGWRAAGFSYEAKPSTSALWSPEGGSLLLKPGVLTSARLPAKFPGILYSPTFVLTHDHIHLRMNAKAAKVRLVIDGHYMNHFHQLLLKGTILKPGDTDTGGEFRWLTLSGDLDKYAGHRVWLEIADLDGGQATIDEILLSNDALPPEPDAWETALLSRVEGDGREALAAAMGTLWAESLAGLRRGNPDPAELALLNGLWRADLWPRDAELLAAAADWKRLEAPAPLFATALMDGDPETERIHLRGNAHNLGDEAPRRNLAALGGQAAPAGASGRLDLARALVSEDNPLVRRVLVNRVWHHLFGRGIVPTPDDFGFLGQRPSHPELLDRLAADFSGEMDWSLKRLIKTIVLSHTYRVGSAANPANDPGRLAVVDPENILLHRAPVRRLEGEAIRDAILAVSGRLDPTVGGPSIPVHLTGFMDGRGRPKSAGPLDGAGRRSLYTEIRRNFLPPLMMTFDMPVPFNAMGRRGVSNVPAQALALMNDPFVVEQAGLWAKRIADDTSLTDEQRIERLFLDAYGRKPTHDESRQLTNYLGQENPDEAWRDLCHALFNKKEFIYLN
ncbi:MAG: PSD1 domain-containing protein, partial [Verrucomicrobiae bacterium]|nr:PSD1 domain-containing protein [Verrucomicrobiae bacterium]